MLCITFKIYYSFAMNINKLRFTIQQVLSFQNIRNQVILTINLSLGPYCKYSRNYIMNTFSFPLNTRNQGRHKFMGIPFFIFLQQKPKSFQFKFFHRTENIDLNLLMLFNIQTQDLLLSKETFQVNINFSQWPMDINIQFH